jgi:hypothetical protein
MWKNRPGAKKSKDKEDSDDSFDEDKIVLHIFTTTEKSDKKSILCVVNATVPPVPQWLPWSEVDISWTRADHPPIVQKPG